MFRLDIEDVFAKSWERWKTALGDVILYSLIYGFGILVFTLFSVFIIFALFVPALVVSAGIDLERIRSFEDFLKAFGGILPLLIVGIIFVVLIISFVTIAWEAGWRVTMMKILRGEKPTFLDLFSQFPKILHLFLASIVIGFIVAVGIIMFLIPGIIFAILFSQTIYLIIEKNRDFLSAMGESWNRVSRDFWQITGILVLLNMAQVGIGLMASVLNVFTFVPIGSLVVALLVLPYFMLARWVLYFALFPRQEPAVLAESLESYEVPPPDGLSDDFASQSSLAPEPAFGKQATPSPSPVPSESAQAEPTPSITTEEGDVSLDPEANHARGTASHDKNQENPIPPD